MIRTLSTTLPLALFLLMACGGATKGADTTAADDTSTGTAADDTSATGVEGDPAAGDGTTAAGSATAAAGSAAEQVAQGEMVWGDACSMCHGDEGEGNGKKNPAVVGDGALSKYKTAADLYAYIKEKMPKDDPGSLSEAEAWAVTAWVLSKNGKLGSAALTAESAPSLALQ